MNHNTPLIVIQARAGSSRLPRKMLQTFYQGRSLLRHVLANLKQTFPTEQIVVATSDTTTDDPIEDESRLESIRVFRGSETNVLRRFADTAQRYNADGIVRVCGDNPFLQNHFINDMIHAWNDSLDYLSFAFPDGTPSIRSHCGLFAEIISTRAIQQSLESCDSDFYREHLTSFVLDNPTTFNCQFLAVPDSVASRPHLRLTVDTERDFEVAQHLTKAVYGEGDSLPTLQNLLDAVDARPQLRQSMLQQIDQNAK